MRVGYSVYWDDVILPFGNPPSVCVPGVRELQTCLDAGVVWIWFYKGMPQVIPLDIMENALQAYEDHKRKGFRGHAEPKDIGVFRWSQTITLEEAEKIAQARPAD